MKILKTLYTATLCAAMAVSTSSCLNSWLDQSPADGIDAETAIKNSDDLANVRTGLYAAVKGNSSLINYYGRLMFVYGDISNMNITVEVEEQTSTIIWNIQLPTISPPQQPYGRCLM